MGKQPAVIIIVRHGPRLDAADKSWHLTSPTPYDPPLTYGGWTQSRSLGLRIAALLDQRQELLASNQQVGPDVPVARKRKHKVFVHSSPFTRCIQTSIAISAGLSQYQAIVVENEMSATRQRSNSQHQHSPRLHAVDTSILAARNNFRRTLHEQRKQEQKSALRVDAYLGEWLSPEYFESITPPPPSNLMVTSAKAELARRADHVSASSQTSSQSRVNQGNLWGSRGGPEQIEPVAVPKLSDGPLDMKQLAQTLPGRDRTSSYSSGRISPFGRPAIPRARSNEPPLKVGYTPPVPNYAISPMEPIPKGYVAHARDACVEVDTLWDSMKEPLAWGDGGEYGEEWSAMHKRFRKGLNHLIDWYGIHGTAGMGEDEDEATSGAVDHPDDHETEEDLVVVLVTHGAGCNALIGALTEQPVLLDVGTASLTMAFRKEDHAASDGELSPKTDSPDTKTSSSEASPVLGRVDRKVGSVSTGLSQKYEMKVIASTDHLRPGTDPSRPSSPAAMSPSLVPSGTIPDSRRRSTLLSHAGAGNDSAWSIGEYQRGGVSTALGSIRRLSTQFSNPPQRSPSVSSTTSTTGLWMPSTPVLQESSAWPVEAETVHSNGQRSSSIGNKLGITYVPDNAHHASIANNRRHQSESEGKPLATVTESPSKVESRDRISDLPKVSPQIPSGLGRTLSQKGLWGSAPSGVVQERDRTPKRRWTLQQQD